MVKQFVDNGKIYRSEPVGLNVSRLVLDPKIINDSGVSQFYTSSIATFSLNLGDAVPDHIAWSIRSNRGHNDFGSIIDGINSDTVTVSFNETGGSPTGILRAEVTKCGVTVVANFVVNLIPKPLPEIPKNKDCSKLPEPSTHFTIERHVYSSDEAITLTVPNYNPDYRYIWHFNATSYIADGEHTYIQFTEPGFYIVRLTVITPDGCSAITPPGKSATVGILKPSFTGMILPDPANFCEDNTTALSYVGQMFQNTKNIIWMRDNIEVSRSKTFMPTRSGSYWVILEDENGYRDYKMVRFPRIYKIYKPPFAGISGTANISYGEELILYGITTDDSVEHRWSGVSVPADFNSWTSNEENKILKINDLPTGTYDYTFYTRNAKDVECVNSFTISVKVTE